MAEHDTPPGFPGQQPQEVPATPEPSGFPGPGESTYTPDTDPVGPISPEPPGFPGTGAPAEMPEPPDAP